MLFRVRKCLVFAWLASFTHHRLASNILRYSLVAILTLAAAPSLAAEKTKIAVLKLKVRPGVDKEQVKQVNDMLLGEIRRFEALDIIGQSEIETMLSFEQSKQLMGCTDEACMVEIGGALGVDRLVDGSVGRIADTLLFNLKLINIRDGKVEQQYSTKIENGTTEDVLNRITEALDELFPDLQRSIVFYPSDIKTDEGKGPWPWIVGGAGVALIGLGVTFTIMNDSNFDELNDTPRSSPKRQELEDAVDRNKALAITGYVVGGLALAGGLTWLLWPTGADVPPDETDSSAEPSMSFAPLVGPGFAGLKVQW